MNPVQLLLIALVLVYLLVRRMAGEPLRARRLLVLPLALAAYGGYELSRQVHGHLSPVDVTLLTVEVVLALALGAARGATVRVYPHDGYLWYRYRWSTLAIWAVSALVRVGLAVGGRLAGSHLPGTATLILMFAVSLLGEAAAVAPRALAGGVPFAPSGTRSRRLAGAATGRYGRD